MGGIFGRIFASEMCGAYFREGLFFKGGRGLLSEFYGISIGLILRMARSDMDSR